MRIHICFPFYPQQITAHCHQVEATAARGPTQQRKATASPPGAKQEEGGLAEGPTDPRVV